MNNIISVEINGNSVSYSVEFNGTEQLKTSTFNNPEKAEKFFNKLVDAWLVLPITVSNNTGTMLFKNQNLGEIE